MSTVAAKLQSLGDMRTKKPNLDTLAGPRPRKPDLNVLSEAKRLPVTTSDDRTGTKEQVRKILSGLVRPSNIPRRAQEGSLPPAKLRRIG